MRKIILVLIVLSIYSCSNSGTGNNSNNNNDSLGQQEDIVAITGVDLKEIKERGTLRALTVFSPTDYFLYKGQRMGFEYELLNNFCESINVELEIVKVDNIDNIIKMLLLGEGDLIAHGLAMTKDRRKLIDFTSPHKNIHQVLVQKKPEKWWTWRQDDIDNYLVKDVLELLNDTVSVRINSSYSERLINIMDETGGKIHIDTIPGTFSTESIIEMVSNGEKKFTIADNNLAEINKAYYNNLDVNTKVSLTQRVAWSLRKDSDELEEAINLWMKKVSRNGFFNIVYKKYFDKPNYKKLLKSDYFTLKTGNISKYDDLIKKHSDNIGWDWRFLSAQVYQESKFDPHSKSWAGADGLLQIMPRTAKELGMKNNSPDENLRAGTKYLKHIYERWSEIPDSIQRIKFTLASFNCGIGHVQDAQILTDKEGGNMKIWDENVEKSILKLSHEEYFNRNYINHGYVRGSEPYNYVRDIFERYHNYKEFVSE